jgi:hypothetical protein
MALDGVCRLLNFKWSAGLLNHPLYADMALAVVTQRSIDAGKSRRLKADKIMDKIVFVGPG